MGLITGIKQVKETAEGYPTMAEKRSWPAAHHFLAHVPRADWRQRSLLHMVSCVAQRGRGDKLPVRACDPPSTVSASHCLALWCLTIESVCVCVCNCRFYATWKGIVMCFEHRKSQYGELMLFMVCVG